eukprot:PITA_06297
MLLVGNDKEIIPDLKTQLSSKFDMKDLGAANYILGMEIKRDRAKRKLWLNQRKYVETILQRFNMQDSKPVKGPIPVGVRFMSKPGKEHWTAVKRVFRYLRGTSDYGLCYQGRPGWTECWISVALLMQTGLEIWIREDLQVEIVFKYGVSTGSYKIDCDSQSAIFLAKNPAYHSKTKHIDVQYPFVRDMIEDKKVLLVKVDTLKNTADALTKSVSSEKFSWHRETMGVSGLEK